MMQSGEGCNVLGDLNAATVGYLLLSRVFDLFSAAFICPFPCYFPGEAIFISCALCAKGRGSDRRRRKVAYDRAERQQAQPPPGTQTEEEEVASNGRVKLNNFIFFSDSLFRLLVSLTFKRKKMQRERSRTRKKEMGEK